MERHEAIGDPRGDIRLERQQFLLETLEEETIARRRVTGQRCLCDGALLIGDGGLRGSRVDLYGDVARHTLLHCTEPDRLVTDREPHVAGDSGESRSRRVDEDGADHTAVRDEPVRAAPHDADLLEQLAVQVVAEAEDVERERAAEASELLLQGRHETHQRKHISSRLAIREEVDHEVGVGLGLGGSEGCVETEAETIPQIRGTRGIKLPQHSGDTRHTVGIHRLHGHQLGRLAGEVDELHRGVRHLAEHVRDREDRVLDEVHPRHLVSFGLRLTSLGRRLSRVAHGT